MFGRGVAELSPGEMRFETGRQVPDEVMEAWHSAELEERIHRLTLETGSPASAGDEVHSLPDDLEDISPGPFLAAILASVDLSRLTGYDLVRHVRAQERLISHGYAGFYAGITELAHAYDPDTTARDSRPGEFASDELQAALGKTRRSADYELGLALDLCRRLPDVWTALSEGRIDLARARVFSQELEPLRPALIPEVVDPILPVSTELTTGQLRARLERAVTLADPETAIDRYRAGLEDRRLVVYPNPDHTAGIGIHQVDPLEAALASEHVDTLAMKLRRLPGETRTLDQIRADVALDLLKGQAVYPRIAGRPVETRIEIHLHDGATAHLPGYGPLLADCIVSPALRRDGVAIDVIDESARETTDAHDEDCHDTPGRRPTNTQVGHVRARYPTCVFPGCRVPARKCDIDHRRPHARGGKTTCANLAPLCRRHHCCKDEGRWRLDRTPDQGHTWTSPLGHTYRTGRPP